MTFDGKAFGLEIVAAVKAHVSDVMGPVVARLDALEKHISELPAPQDGKDADLAEVKAMIDGAIAGLPPFPDFPEIPAAPELPDIPAMVAEAVAAIPAPQDGKSVTADELRPLVEESVSKAASAIPAAKDGNPGKDGVGLAGALIDRSGNLVLTLTDGTTREMGLVVGKDGAPGRDGTDGLGFDDMAVEYDGARKAVFRFARGEQVKEFAFSLPALLDCGVYKDGSEYEAGDVVTWAGSMWIAQENTSEKPDGGKGWRLAVKKGRDGKDAGKAKP